MPRPAVMPHPSMVKLIRLTIYIVCNILAAMHLEPQSFLRALADPTRLRLLVLLQQHDELCVCELSHALDTIQPKISRHLAILRKKGVLLDRRQGQWVYYRIHPEIPAWAYRALTAVVEGASAQQPYISDRKALQSMGERPGGSCAV